MADKEADDPVLLRFRKMSRPARVVYARPRTFFSMAIGIVAFFLLPGSLRLVTRLLLAWDIFITLYLLLVYTMVLRSGLAAYQAQRGAAGRWPLPDPAGDRARRLCLDRRDRVRTRRLASQRARNWRWRR